jgi:hypothetical protein
LICLWTVTSEKQNTHSEKWRPKCGGLSKISIYIWYQRVSTKIIRAIINNAIVVLVWMNYTLINTYNIGFHIRDVHSQSFDFIQSTCWPVISFKQSTRTINKIETIRVVGNIMITPRLMQAIESID